MKGGRWLLGSQAAGCPVNSSERSVRRKPFLPTFSNEERLKGGFLFMPVSLKFYCAFGHLKKNLLWASRPTRKVLKRKKPFTSSSSCAQLRLHTNFQGKLAQVYLNICLLDSVLCLNKPHVHLTYRRCSINTKIPNAIIVACYYCHLKTYLCGAI